MPSSSIQVCRPCRRPCGVRPAERPARRPPPGPRRPPGRSRAGTTALLGMGDECGVLPRGHARPQAGQRPVRSSLTGAQARARWAGRSSHRVWPVARELPAARGKRGSQVLTGHWPVDRVTGAGRGRGWRLSGRRACFVPGRECARARLRRCSPCPPARPGRRRPVPARCPRSGPRSGRGWRRAAAETQRISPSGAEMTCRFMPWWRCLPEQKAGPRQPGRSRLTCRRSPRRRARRPSPRPVRGAASGSGRPAGPRFR